MIGRWLSRESVKQFLKMAVSGGVATLIYFALLNVLRFMAEWSSFWAVTGAFVVATAANYLLNRRWTFRLSLELAPAESVAFFTVAGGAWVLTVLIVQMSEYLFGPLGPVGLNVTNIVADGVLVVPKFLTYKFIVFRRSLEQQTMSKSVGSATSDSGHSVRARWFKRETSRS